MVGVGEGGSDIPVEDALGHVYGYCVGVDLTRRDLQREAKDTRRPWDTSKGFDLSAPCGLLIPVKERGHVREGCVMEMSLNGKIVQKTELRKMIWKVSSALTQPNTKHAIILPHCAMTRSQSSCIIGIKVKHE